MQEYNSKFNIRLVSSNTSILVYRRMAQVLFDRFQNLQSGCGYSGPRSKHGCTPGFMQKLVVLRGYYSSTYHNYVVATRLLEFLYQLRNQCSENKNFACIQKDLGNLNKNFQNILKILQKYSPNCFLLMLLSLSFFCLCWKKVLYLANQFKKPKNPFSHREGFRVTRDQNILLGNT